MIVIFTLGLFHSNKNEERIKDSGFWARRSQVAGMKGTVPVLHQAHRMLPQKRKMVSLGSRRSWKIITAERQRDQGPSRQPWVRQPWVGVGRVPFPLAPVCFMGCDNMVVSGRACVHMYFLVCYGNMAFLFFYLYSLWSLGSWLLESRTLNSPTHSLRPHNHPLSRGIR